jgi:hypothetical protein
VTPGQADTDPGSKGDDLMTTSAELLVDAFGRISEEVHRVLDGVSGEALTYAVDRRANTIAWLIWHLTRVQDDHLADAAGTEQVWTAQGWNERLALPLDSADTGYGHRPEQVAAVNTDAPSLLEYFDAVHGATLRIVGNLSDADLARVVDERWDPPVTLGVRLISVIADDLQHVGQAAYVRGVFERR